MLMKNEVEGKRGLEKKGEEIKKQCREMKSREK